MLFLVYISNSNLYSLKGTGDVLTKLWLKFYTLHVTSSNCVSTTINSKEKLLLFHFFLFIEIVDVKFSFVCECVQLFDNWIRCMTLDVQSKILDKMKDRKLPSSQELNAQSHFT